jgi:hypothetical protein
MKKTFILMIGFLIVSCSKDDSQSPNSISNTNLVSFTKNYYSNNNFSASEKLNFYNDKLINIQYHDGSHDEYQYDNDLVSRILKFDSNDILFWTITYLYDNLGRIIEIKRIPSSTNVQIQSVDKFSFVYNTNQILINSVYTPGGVDTYELNLDQNKKIINEKLISTNGRIITDQFYFTNTFTNGNLTNSIMENSTPTDKITYSYNNFKNDFDYNKFLFGKHWKNNKCLDLYKDERSVRGTLETTSEYLIANSTHNFNNVSENATYSYLFNEKNQITKEIVTKTSTFVPTYKIESIYKYE